MKYFSFCTITEFLEQVKGIYEVCNIQQSDVVWKMDTYFNYFLLDVDRSMLFGKKLVILIKIVLSFGHYRNF